jgi:hypothetical protein
MHVPGSDHHGENGNDGEKSQTKDAGAVWRSDRSMSG